MTTIKQATRILSISLCVLTGCGQSQNNAQDSDQKQTAALILQPKSTFQEIEWTDLMPKADLEALMTPPAYVSEIKDGSLEDVIGNEFPNIDQATADDPYQKALVSTDIIPEMDQQAIRLSGFIVPLEFDDNMVITQFFLVPFFGACIHVPPPPPNQIIFVDYPAGLTQNALDDPFWVSGILKTSLTQNQMATSAYSLEVHHIEPYTEEYN